MSKAFGAGILRMKVFWKGFGTLGIGTRRNGTVEIMATLAYYT